MKQLDCRSQSHSPIGPSVLRCAHTAWRLALAPPKKKRVYRAMLGPTYNPHCTVVLVVVIQCRDTVYRARILLQRVQRIMYQAETTVHKGSAEPEVRQSLRPAMPCSTSQHATL